MDAPSPIKFPSSTHCDCWRLTSPLAPGDPLPDHVCFFTMRETIRRAIGSGLLLEADTWPVRFRSGRVASARALGFVIRQWVEGQASPVLAQLLVESKMWQREARHLLDTYRFWREKRPERDVSEWIAGVGTNGLRLDERLRCHNLPYTPTTVAHLRAVTAGLDVLRRQSPQCQRD